MNTSLTRRTATTLRGGFALLPRAGCLVSRGAFAGLALAATFASNRVFAQSAADSAYAALTTPAATAAAASTPPAGSTDNIVAGEIAQLQQTAQNAQAFCSTYSTDPRRSCAGKIGVMAALQAAQLGADKSSALALATAYSQDSSNAVADRVDVAFTSGVLALPLNGRRLIDAGAMHYDLVDQLHATFGDVDPVFSRYTDLLKTTDAATAVTVANEVLGMTNAPVWARAVAQTVLTRHGLIGQPLKVMLTTRIGMQLDLSQPVGVPTLIYYWSNQAGTGDLRSLATFASSVPAGTRVIYVCLLADLTQMDAAQQAAPLSNGIFCFLGSGFNSPEESALGLNQLPYVYVLNKDGLVAGYGRPEDLPALFQAIGPKPPSPASSASQTNPNSTTTP